MVGWAGSLCGVLWYGVLRDVVLGVWYVRVLSCAAFYGVAEDPGSNVLYIVEEYAAGGDLVHLVTQKFAMAPYVMCKLARDIIGGL